ncbi:hypothetical protein M9458_054161, partial [Cirrhinus mrigala]
MSGDLAFFQPSSRLFHGELLYKSSVCVPLSSESRMLDFMSIMLQSQSCDCHDD